MTITTRPTPTKLTVSLMVEERAAIYHEAMLAFQYILAQKHVPDFIHMPDPGEGGDDGEDWKSKPTSVTKAPPGPTPEQVAAYMNEATESAIAMFIHVQNRVQGFASNIDHMPAAPEL